MALWTDNGIDKAYYRDPETRLAVFRDAGLIDVIPTRWQLRMGSFEMAPYVVMPDAGDDNRYAGAPLGHPLLRTPIVFARIGPEHLHIGHGLMASLKAILRHCMFVFHEGMPAYDLQLVHSLPGGLSALREYATNLQEGTSAEARRERRVIDLIVPEAEAYRNCFLEPGGWIDRAEAFDYPSTEDVADFLRPEFTDLCRFAAYCATTFPASPQDRHPLALAREVGDLMTRCFRGYTPAQVAA